MKASRLVAGLTLLGFASLSGTALVRVTTSGAAPRAPATSSSTSCDKGRPPAVVYFGEAPTPRTPSPRLVQVRSVTIRGLAPACDGATVVLDIGGNRAGDPSEPAALLSTADSAVEPCSQKTRSSPLTVEHGSIGLTLCARGGPARDTPAYEVTRLALLVTGFEVPVTPVPGTAGGTNSTAPPGNTGAPTGTRTGTPPGKSPGTSGSTHKAVGATGTAGGAGGGGGPRGTSGDGVSAGAPSEANATARGGRGFRASSPASGSSHHELVAANLVFDWWPLLLVLLGLLLLLVIVYLAVWRRRRDEKDGRAAPAS